jgi:hypothetical protein
VREREGRGERSEGVKREEESSPLAAALQRLSPNETGRAFDWIRRLGVPCLRLQCRRMTGGAGLAN